MSPTAHFPVQHHLECSIRYAALCTAAASNRLSWHVAGKPSNLCTGNAKERHKNLNTVLRARRQCSYVLVAEHDLCARRRPTYTITCENGEQQEVPDEALERLREPKSPMMPDAPMPPSIAAPSPSDGAPLDDSPLPPSPKAPSQSFHTQPSPQAPFAASRPSATPGRCRLPRSLTCPCIPPASCLPAAAATCPAQI